MPKFALLRLFSLCAALACAAPAASGEVLPEGGYVLVDPFQSAERDGYTVPVITWMQVSGDRLDFSFLTYVRPTAFDCESRGKCDWSAEALSATYAIGVDGTLSLSDVERHAGPGAVIDRPELDELIVSPVALFLEGAGVEAREGEIVFRAAGARPPEGAVSAQMRFLASTLEETEAAIDFERMYEFRSHDLGRCVIRRIAETRAIPPEARKPAQTDFLGAVDVYGAYQALSAKKSEPVNAEAPAPARHPRSRWSAKKSEPVNAEAGPELKLLTFALNASLLFPDLSPEAALDEAIAIAKAPAALVEERIAPNRRALIWLSEHMKRFYELRARPDLPADAPCAFLAEEIDGAP
ncbi:MAG: hypothetical protein ACK5MQ_06945 [Pikeienuella sp.]